MDEAVTLTSPPKRLNLAMLEAFIQGASFRVLRAWACGQGMTLDECVVWLETVCAEVEQRFHVRHQLWAIANEHFRLGFLKDRPGKEPTWADIARQVCAEIEAGVIGCGREQVDTGQQNL